MKATKNPNGVKVDYQRKPRYLLVVVGGLFWLWGAFASIQSFKTGTPLWGAGFLWILSTIALWEELVSREITEVNVPDLSLKIHRSIIGFWVTRSFALRSVTNLRISDVEEADVGLVAAMDSHLAFEYEGKTVRFARRMDQSEIKSIYDALREFVVPLNP